MFGEWTVHVVGFGFIITLLGLMVFFPRSEWTQALLTTYGVRGSGEAGATRRSDHLRGAAASFGLSLLFVALSFAAISWAAAYPGLSRTNWTLTAYGFGLMLLGGVSALAGCGALWRAVRWRPAEPVEIANATDAPVA